MTVPYAFGAATTAIPLSQLDDNFNTTITLGNTAIQLGNTVTTLNNMTLANVTISSGNVTLTNVTVTTANATTVNTTTLIATTANVTTINATDINVAANVTLNGGTANGVAYLNGSKVLTTGSALTFDGTRLTVKGGNANSLWVDNGGQRYTELDIANNGTIKSSIYWDNTSADLFYSSTGSATFGVASYYAWNISSEQMRLTSTGLGIGTSSPTNKLHVYGTSVVGMFESSGSEVFAGLKNTGGTSYIGARSTAITFDTGGTERMRLDSSGNLGLGVTPSAWSSSVASQVGYGAALSSRAAGNTASDMTHGAYWNGTNWLYQYSSVGAARYQMTGASAGSTHAWFVSAGGTAGNAISFTQAMTLDASGRLFVGPTSAASVGNARFAVTGGSTYDGQFDLIAQLTNDTTSASKGVLIGYNNTSNTGIISSAYGNGSQSLAFWTHNNTAWGERARITSGGDLLVGTTTNTGPGKVMVSFNGTTNNGISLYESTDTTGSAYLAFRNSAGVAVGTVTRDSASSVAYNTSSDYRLKNITGPITTSGAYIDSLNPVEGTWKADGSTFVGLIAHEVQEASRTNVATGVKNGEQMQGMDYSSAEIIANLIAELQSLRRRVAQLEGNQP